MYANKTKDYWMKSELQDAQEIGKAKSAKLFSISTLEETQVYVSAVKKKRIQRVLKQPTNDGYQNQYLLTFPGLKVLRYNGKDSEIELLIERFLITHFPEISLKTEKPKKEQKPKKEPKERFVHEKQKKEPKEPSVQEKEKKNNKEPHLIIDIAPTPPDTGTPPGTPQPKKRNGGNIKGPKTLPPAKLTASEKNKLKKKKSIHNLYADAEASRIIKKTVTPTIDHGIQFVTQSGFMSNITKLIPTVPVDIKISGEGVDNLRSCVSELTQTLGDIGRDGLGMRHSMSFDPNIPEWTKLVAVAGAVAYPIYQYSIYGEIDKVAMISAVSAAMICLNTETCTRVLGKLSDLVAQQFVTQSILCDIRAILVEILIDIWGSLVGIDVKNWLKKNIIMMFLKDYSRIKLSLTSLAYDLRDLLLIVINFIREKVLGWARITSYDTSFSQLADFSKDTQLLIKKFESGDLKFNYTTFKLYQELVSRGEELMRMCMGKDLASFRATVVSINSDLRKFGKVFDSLNICFGKTKVKAVSALFRGAPGVGKTLTLHPLALEVLSHIIPPEYNEVYEKNPDAFIFLRLFACKYWDGYGPLKMIIIYDDFNQTVDVAGNPDNEASEAIGLGHRFPMMLHCADMSQKNRIWSVAEVILYSTNSRDFDFKSIRCTEAVLRRFDLCYDVAPPMSKMKENPIDGDLWSRRLDASKLEGALDLTACEYHEYDLLKKCYTGVVLSYNLVVKAVIDKHTAYAEEFSAYELAMDSLLQSRREMRLSGFTNRDAYEKHLAELRVSDPDVVSVANVRDNALRIEGLNPEINETPFQILQIEDDGSVPIHIQRQIYNKLCSYLMYSDLLTPVKVMRELAKKVFDDVPVAIDSCTSFIHGDFSQFWDCIGHVSDSEIVDLKPDPHDSPNFRRREIREEDNKSPWAEYEYQKKMLAVLASHLGCVASFSAVVGLGMYMAKKTITSTSGGEEVDTVKEKETTPNSSGDVTVPCNDQRGNGSRAHSSDIQIFTPVLQRPVVESFGHTNPQKKATISTKRNELAPYAKAQALASSTKDERILVDVTQDLFKEHVPISKVPTTVELEMMDLDVNTAAGRDFNTIENFVSKSQETISTLSIVTQTQGVDLSLENIMEKVFIRNTYAVTINETRLGYAVFVKGRVMIMPCHFYRLIKRQCDLDGATTVTLKKLSTQRSQTFPCGAFLRFKVHFATENDVCAIYIDSAELHTNILPLFVGPDYFTHRMSFNAILHKPYSKIKEYGRVLVSKLARPIVDSNGEELCDRIVLAMSINSAAGDCGSLMYINDPSVGCKRIVGMHIAGGNGSVALSVPICLTNVLSFANDMEEIDNPHDTFRVQCQVPRRYDGLEPAFLVPKPLFLPKASNITPSPLYNTYKVPTTMPVYLDHVDLPIGPFDPLAFAVKKYIRLHSAHLDDQELRAAARNVLCKMNRASLLYPAVKKEVFGFEDAVAGVPGLDFCDGIPRATSPGYPYQMMAPKGSKGKTYWFGHEGDYKFSSSQTQELHKRVIFMREQCANGVMPEVYFKDFMKDERKPIEKVAKGTARLISGASIDYVILVRMYFMAFVMAFTMSRVHSGSNVGINAYSEEWDTLFTMFKAVDEEALDADHKSFDVSHMGQVLRLIVFIINLWYNDGPVNAKIREALFEAFINSHHIVGNFVYVRFGGLSSGHPLTVVINCLINLILLRVIYARLTGDTKFLFYDRDVAEAVYGDDLALAVAKTIQDVFNFATISREMNTLGYSITPARKDDSSGAFAPTEELTFLKRGFRFCEIANRTVAPLDLDVILEIPCWIKKNNDIDPLDQMVANVHCCFRELTFHGYDIYTEWTTKVTSAVYEQTGVSLMIEDFDVLLSEVLQQEASYVSN